jgi:hypothetical protein
MNDHAASIGADLDFFDVPREETADIEDLVVRARHCVENGRQAEATSAYRRVLGATDPPLTPVARVARGEACAFFARVALSKKRHGGAAEWYHEALRADPAAVDYRLELASKCYLPMRLLDSGVVEARRATEIDPENVAAWVALGNLAFERQDLRLAATAYDRAMALAPSSVEAKLGRAALALDMSDHDLVSDLCDWVITTDRAADAVHLLAMLSFREGRYEEAIRLFDVAIGGNCYDSALAHWHKSHAMESIGMWPEAWSERAHRAGSSSRSALTVPMKRFDRPLWSGEPGSGRVHVHAETGAGDNICLARYLPMIAQRGLDVCYECMPDMVDLMRRSFPGVEVVPRTAYYPDALGVKPFDYHLPVGELQTVFRTSLETVPWKGPYLKSDLTLVEKYRENARGKIGLCWSSGIRLNDSAWLAEYGRRKSMSFEALRPIWSSEAECVSLQVGPERAEHRDRIFDYLPEQPTWDDTAALVECLDLVITVDTAVAHLAGAMGKPTWLMMHTEGSWHWMAPRLGASWNERSPWYPSVRIYRQERAKEWRAVIERIARDLVKPTAIAVE